MAYTLGEAAKATGVSKSSLSRAIEKGRISATKNDDGSFSIEPVELHRVYPPRSAATVVETPAETTRNPSATGGDAIAIKVLEARLEGLQQQLRTVEEHNRELNQRLDQSTEQQMRLTLMLAGPTIAVRPPSKSWFRRLYDG